MPRESTVWAGTYDSDIRKYMIGTGYDTGHEVSTYLSSQDQHYTCKGSALTDSNGTLFQEPSRLTLSF